MTEIQPNGLDAGFLADGDWWRSKSLLFTPIKELLALTDFRLELLTPLSSGRAMDQILANISNTRCILDDMIITSSTDEEHLKKLSLVFQRIEQHGLRMWSFRDKISYCGHIIDKDGLQKSSEKTNVVKNAPKPDMSQLSLFLGLVNYYHRFLPNPDTVVGPPNELLKTNRKWK